jgi:hypothetical protein
VIFAELAREAVAFHAEFIEAGFRRTEVRTVRKGRTKNPYVLAAEVTAVR